MKKISKTIATLGLSLLAMSAIAQVSYKGAPIQQQGKPKAASHAFKSHRASRVSNTMTSFQLFYPGTDASLSPNYSTSIGLFADQINNRFVEGDTGTSNYSLIHSATVAFDTLIDGYLNSYNANSVIVDTLWVVCAYRNTSNKNDTLVFSIDQVGPTGLPTATVYTTAIVPLYKGVTFATTTGPVTIPGTNDSIYVALAVPNFTIPGNNIHFAVNVTFNGSKLDTFELTYGFPLSICSANCGGFPYANPHTSVGDLYTGSRTINVNSYSWGFQEYFSNTVTMEPQANGCIFANNNYEWNVCPSCFADTMYFYEQDYEIAASVTGDVTTGTNKVNASGLSVSQNYPNPFNKTTQISYNLTKSSDVTFSVYDMTGRVLVNNVYTNSGAGAHTINLSANSFSPGIYFYSFNVNGSIVTKKMVITE